MLSAPQAAILLFAISAAEALCSRVCIGADNAGSLRYCSVLLARSTICSDAPLTWTLKLPLALLPVASVAVQLTIVLPIANVEPDAGAQLTLGFGSTLSVAVALKVTIA